MNHSQYSLPKNTLGAWLVHRNKTPQNPGLVFDRFVQDWGQGQDSEAKKKAWEEIVGAARKADAALLQQWQLRWQTTVKSAGARPFTMETSWRLISGLGSKGLLEVGFTFHRYGFPFLPGSSVKGIARAWGLQLLAQKFAQTGNLVKFDELLSLDEEEKFNRALAEDLLLARDEDIGLAKNFRSIFGTRGCAGNALFFDAIPVQLPKLELDVMNPHYADYYQDEKRKTPPASWQNPVPVYFLTVPKGSEFSFAVGWRKKIGKESDRLHGLAEKWLKAGLETLGAGAKTSAGYGYFISTGKVPVHQALPLKDQDLAAKPSPTQKGTALAGDEEKSRADQLILEIQNIKTTAVAGSINQYYQRWRDEKISPEQKRRIAEAIVTKVKEAGREKQSREKEWYKELLASLGFGT